jgi:hypothetical protein
MSEKRYSEVGNQDSLPASETGETTGKSAISRIPFPVPPGLGASLAKMGSHE